ncbi:PDZ domain-containing protein [soil metagenome]
MHKYLIFLLLLVFKMEPITAQSLSYTLSFPEPQTHYVNVRMEITGIKASSLVLKMPVWTPGSYLVREFSRNVESLEVLKDTSSLKIEKLSKNSWKVNTGGAASLIVNYKVYAFELTVRTSFIDEDHAYLNGASIFLFAEGFTSRPCKVTIKPWKNWTKISVALDPVVESNPWTVLAENYDLLIDSPFEIGNHLLFKFTAAGVPHEVAMFGEGNFDVDRLQRDMTKIIEECTRIFGEHPCKRYVFIIHNLNSGGGGLEHLNSTTLQTGKWQYAQESSYNGFLALVAHEYFHLWNVKRLSPEALGPFNYDEENYTNMLYVTEGFTAYYDDLITRRCGFYSPDAYLNILSGNISYCDNTPGAKIQPVSDAGFDAWIKYYRPNENSTNATVSYYTKGSVIGAMLDFAIIGATKGDKNLDDLMSYLYQEFYKKLHRGYSDREFIEATSKIAGINMDSFFNDYVYGIKSIPYAQFCSEMGLKISNSNEKQTTSWLGASSSIKDGKLTVTSVERNSPAWVAGINVNDELIAMDQYRLNDDLARLMAMKKPGDKSVFTVSRAGYIRLVDVTLGKTPYVKYLLEPDNTSGADKPALFKKWMHLQ